jgi:hypothetical protein
LSIVNCQLSMKPAPQHPITPNHSTPSPYSPHSPHSPKFAPLAAGGKEKNGKNQTNLRGKEKAF